ncbi:14282_t:CDS:2, partial [Racocetra fulgida]
HPLQFHQNSPFGNGNSPSMTELPPKMPDLTPQVENSDLVNLMPFNNSSDLITPSATSSSQQPNRLSVTIEPEDEGDNWDADFVDSIPFAKIADIQSKQLNHKSSDEDNAQTIRPGRFKSGRDKSKKSTVSRDDKDNKEDIFQKKVSLNNKGNKHQEKILRENKQQEIARDKNEPEKEKIERIADAIVEDKSEEKDNGWESMQDTVIRIKSNNSDNSNNTEYTKVLAKPPLVSPVAKSIETSKNNKTITENPAIKSIIKHHTRAHSANSIPSPISSSQNGTNVMGSKQLPPLPTHKSTSSTVSATATSLPSRRTALSQIEMSPKQQAFNRVVVTPLPMLSPEEDSQNS